MTAVLRFIVRLSSAGSILCGAAMLNESGFGGEMTTGLLATGLWDLSSDLAAVASRDGHLKAVNASWERVLAWSPDEPAADSFLDLVHPDDVATTAAALQSLAESGRVTVSFVSRCRGMDGRYHLLCWKVRASEDGQDLLLVASSSAGSEDSVEARPAPRPSGDRESAPVGEYHGSGTDRIVWVEGADAELVSGAQRFPSEYSGLGLVVHASSGAIVGANAEAGALLGLDLDQLVGRTSRDPRWAAVSEQGLPLAGDQHPAMRTLATGEPVADFMMGVLIPDRDGPGRTRWLDICTYPLRAGAAQIASDEGSEAGGSGRSPVGAVAVFADASQTLRGQAAANGLLAGYRLLADNATDAVFLIDADGVFVWASPATARVLGHDPLSLIGTNGIDLVHPDDSAGIGSIQARVEQGEDRIEFEVRELTATGGYRWMSGIVARVPFLEGAGERRIVTLRDIHEQVLVRAQLADLAEQLARSRAELAAENERRELVLAGTRLGLWDWNMVTDELVIDERWAQMLGYERAELEPVSIDAWNRLSHPDDLARAYDLIFRSTQDPDVHYDIEVRMRHRLGRWVDVRTRGEVVEWTSDGRPLRMTGTHEDITELVQAQRHLAAAERQYRLLAENATDVVYQLDADSVLQWISPSVQRVLGWRPEQLLGTRTADLAHPDDLPALAAWDQEVIAAALAGSQSGPLELRCRTADGGYRWISVQSRPTLSDDGVITGTVVGVRDINEQVLTRRDVQLLWDMSVDLLAVADLDGYLTSVNASWERVLGYSPQEITSRPYLDLVHPDDIEATLQKAQDLLEPGQVTTNFVVQCRCKDGTYRWLDWSSRTAEDGGQVYCIARDVTDEVLARRTEQMRHQLLAENASDVVWQVAPDGRLEWVSHSVTAALGRDPEALAGRFALDLIHPEDRAQAVDDRARVLSGGTVATEYRILCADGSFRAMAIRRRAVDDASGVEVATLRDIQAELDVRQLLTHAAEQDPLTGLATLPVAVARIEHLLGELPEQGRGRMLTVLCVGVDSLKSVNDALTFAGGDRVLASVSARIADVTGNRELLTRGSGDEFVLVIPGLASRAEAGEIADRVRAAAKGPLMIDAHHVAPTVSIGVAMGVSDSDAGGLVRDASLAMRQAKTNGRDRCEFFEPHMAEEAGLLLAVESAIREGLANRQFVPWFQPIVNLSDGALVGYEALVRRVHPDGTVVEPDKFLPIAERSNLIIDLDLVVLAQSVEMLTCLPAPQHVAANLSAATLASVDYAARVIELVNGRGIDPTRLHLEFTETALLAVNGPIRDVMCELADAGVSWYVDDFGTGYSSIAHLRDLPIAGLKLDLSFTAGLGSGDLTAERLAQGLAGLADGLGLDTVAEGVETQAQAAILRAQGWKHGQGWIYGRPAPPPRVPQQPTEPS